MLDSIVVKFVVDHTTLIHFLMWIPGTYFLSPIAYWLYFRAAIPFFSMLTQKRLDSKRMTAFAFSNVWYIKISTAGVLGAWLVCIAGGFLIELDQMQKAVLGPTHYFNPLDWLAGIVGGTVAAAYQFTKVRD